MQLIIIKSNSPSAIDSHKIKFTIYCSEQIKNLSFFFTTIIQFTTMSTAGSESDYNLAVEAMVRKVMSEMAIKSANDTIVRARTETEETVSLSTLSHHEISSEDIASKNTKKQKKFRSRSSTSKRKKSSTWNGDWTASFDGDDIATLKVEDDERGNLQISGFAKGPTTGKYTERKIGYIITFRDADENWIIKGDIEDENTISWSDGTRWDKIPTKDTGAMADGAVGCLLDMKSFKRAQANCVIEALTASGRGYGYESGGDKEEDYEIVDENDEPVFVARALPDFDSDPVCLNGRWRSTFDGDKLAVVTVKDDLDGILTIKGFMGGNTCGKYVRNSVDRIAEIYFIDADENWPVNGDK